MVREVPRGVAASALACAVLTVSGCRDCGELREAPPGLISDGSLVTLFGVTYVPPERMREFRPPVGPVAAAALADRKSVV